MKKTILALSLVCSMGLYADSWSNATRKIPVLKGQWVNHEVYPAYDASSQRPFVAWIDYSNRRPFYSVYDGNKWRNGMPISTQINLSAKANVFLSHDPNANGLISIWVDRKTSVPNFSIFTNNNWTRASTIPIGSSANGAFSDVFIAFDPAINKTIAVWPNLGHAPVYSLFDGANWTQPLPIPVGSSKGVLYNVILSYEAGTGHMVAGWINTSDSAPYTSVFDGSNWSVAAPVELGNSKGGTRDVSLAYNAANQKMMIAWTDAGTRSPYYSQLEISGWSTAQPIPIGASPAACTNVALAYNPFNKCTFAVWGDGVSATPTYTMFNGTSWSDVGLVPLGFAATAKGNPYMAFDPYYLQMVLSWSSYPTLEGSYSFYSDSPAR